MKRQALVALMLLLGIACSQSSPNQSPDVGAGVLDVAAEGLPSEQPSSSETEEPAGGQHGAGIHERGGNIAVIQGEQSFIGQDVVLRGTIAQLIVGRRAFFVTTPSDSSTNASTQSGSTGTGQQQGSGSQQQAQGSSDSQQSATGAAPADCLSTPGTCVLAILDPAVDVTDVNLEEHAQVELAGTVMAFDARAVHDALGGETGDFDFGEYSGQAFLLVRILEVQAAPTESSTSSEE